jgi:hypothetical protein
MVTRQTLKGLSTTLLAFHILYKHPEALEDLSCGTSIIESRAAEIEERTKAASALSQVKMSMELRHGPCAGTFVCRYHWSSPPFLVRSSFRQSLVLQ